MSDPFRIEIDAAEVKAAFARLVAAGTDPRGALLAIGEALTDSTKKRFDTQSGPDGARWAPNAEGTFLDLLDRKSRAKKKIGELTGEVKDGWLRKRDGKTTKEAADMLLGKKILQGETNDLRNTIHYQVSPNSVLIGSPMVYAAAQQFGMKPHTILPRKKKALAFRGLVFKKVDHPGFPARPFIGLSLDDERSILDILASHLEDAVDGK